MEAVRAGRRTFANLRQAMIYTLAVNFPIVGLAMPPVLFGLPLVLARPCCRQRASCRACYKVAW